MNAMILVLVRLVLYILVFSLQMSVIMQMAGPVARNYLWIVVLMQIIISFIWMSLIIDQKRKASNDKSYDFTVPRVWGSHGLVTLMLATDLFLLFLHVLNYKFGTLEMIFAIQNPNIALEQIYLPSILIYQLIPLLSFAMFILGQPRFDAEKREEETHHLAYNHKKEETTSEEAWISSSTVTSVVYIVLLPMISIFSYLYEEETNFKKSPSMPESTSVIVAWIAGGMFARFLVLVSRKREW